MEPRGNLMDSEGVECFQGGLGTSRFGKILKVYTCVKKLIP